MTSRISPSIRTETLVNPFIDDPEIEKNTFRCPNIDEFIPIQSAFLDAIRFFFWNKQWNEYHNLIEGLIFSENEMVLLKEFYIDLAGILARHFSILPVLLSNNQIEKIAQGLIKTGDMNLVHAGKSLDRRATSQKPAQEAILAARNIQEAKLPPDPQVQVPSFRGLPEELISHLREKPHRFLRDYLEQYWTLPRVLTNKTAFLIEALTMDKSSADACLQNYFGPSVTRDILFSDFTQNLVNLLWDEKQYGWAEIVCRILSPCAGDFSHFIECKLGDTFLYQRKDAQAIEIFDRLHSSGKLAGGQTLSFIDLLWRKKEIGKALSIAKSDLKNTRDDFPLLGMMAELFLEEYQLPAALACGCKAFRYSPDQPLIMFTLAKIFHFGYLPRQADLFMNLLRRHPAFPENAKRWFLPAELFLKCPGESTVSLNGKDLGKCPIRVGFVPPGKHEVEWNLQNGTQKKARFNLKEGTIHKYKFRPENGEIEEEESRDGLVRIHGPDGKMTELTTLVKEYLVDSLDDLPDPDISRIFTLPQKA